MIHDDEAYGTYGTYGTHETYQGLIQVFQRIDRDLIATDLKIEPAA
jgi:hypothetical protein